MSQVHISQKNMSLAKKSLTHMYINKFGKDSLSDVQHEFTREDLILKYACNLRFWSDNMPDVAPGMNEFSIAKHAICTNAIENLWKKVEEYNIKKEVDLITMKLE